MKKTLFLVISLMMIFMVVTTALADDGGLLKEDGSVAPVSKSISHLPEATVPGYEDEAEHAFVGYMKFYVPSQHSNGIVEPIDYVNADGTFLETRDLAKPLVGVYMYGPYVEVEGVGFVGHGKRDAWASVSLDDGITWKNTNLSESADLTSETVVRPDIGLFADTDYYYPGDVINMFHSIAGNKVLVAWPSRYCTSGEPNFSLDNPEASEEQLARRAAIAAYLGIDLATASPDDLYLIDMYGVGGSQGSVNYAETDDYEPNQAVGEVPFSCLWTARGVLNQGDDPRTTEVVEASFMRWFKAERLTSGVRDVNRIETQCVAGAGCAITWQEDPEGLRGGQGEGPGEGWSGAVANSQTDVWYSYIDWEDFDVVQDPADASGATWMTLADYELAAAGDSEITQKPKPFVPFAMPMRLTDNAKCNIENPKPYCNGSAINANFPDLPIPMDYGLKDVCADTVMIPTGPENELTAVCVSEDGLPNVGNTAATRPRLGLYGYISTGKTKDPVDSAFVQVVLEEDKGLGAFGFYEDGTACTPEKDNPSCIGFDLGKNIFYHSFTMSLTDIKLKRVKDGETKWDDSLVGNLTFHGDMLNQPEVDWTTGEFYPPANTVDMWDFGAYNYDIYNTEIARRGSLIAQDIDKAYESKNKLIAFPTWKQGQLNQGGPADVMARRILIPKDWKIKNGNPYAFRNMVCKVWAYKDGSNPNYPNGLCMDSAINLSATIPDTCIDSDTGEATACPQVDLSQGTTFGISDTNPILQGSLVIPNKTKVLSWHSCPADFTNVSSTDGTVLYDCDNDLRTDASTLADQSWYNPLDVAKGHRGFLDGDFLMMLYAWSPNWRLNTVGHDRYELYVRRSFTGGKTWTTTPNTGKASDGSKFNGDGTVTCETFRSLETGSDEVLEPRVCNEYAAGAAEQPRNVTQHKSMRITTLDPRYAMTGSPYGVSITSDPFGVGIPNYNGEDDRDPSRYFIVYETGDNQTTIYGEPEPMDLYYSRAINFGDDYVVWADEVVDPTLTSCYPSDPHENIVPLEQIGTGFCNEFDQVEQGIPGLEASEASLQANPGGEFLYAAWAEIAHDLDTGEFVSSDARVRRIQYIDGYVPLNAWIFGQGTGDGNPVTDFLEYFLQDLPGDGIPSSSDDTWGN